MPHLLLHMASVYNGHLQGPLTLAPIAERLTVELSLPVYTNKVCCDLGSNTHPSACVFFGGGGLLLMFYKVKLFYYVVEEIFIL